MRVTSVTGHGEFFDRGDPLPKNATLIVSGVEDALVKGLKLDQLCSAALAERARRRNEQVHSTGCLVRRRAFFYTVSVYYVSLGVTCRGAAEFNSAQLQYFAAAVCSVRFPGIYREVISTVVCQVY